MAAVRPAVPRGATVGIAIAGALLLAAFLGGRPGRDGPPLDPRSDGPLGTSALVAVLRELGAGVELSVGMPDAEDDVAIVLRDRLDDAQWQQLEGWTRDGGTLVLTDPSSPAGPPHAAGELDLPAGPLAAGMCTIPALAGVREVEGGEAIRFAPAPGDRVCFADDQRGAFIVTKSVGAGEIVAVGGAAFLTNDLLGKRDNALLATTLLAPTGSTAVRFVDPPLPVGGGSRTLGDLVPVGVKRGLVQLGVAFGLYALWRAIRLGRPVREDQLVDVAGSALVSAIGRLLARTRAPGAAAEGLRAALRARLRSRLAVPSESSSSTLAEMTAARTAMPIADVLQAVDDRPVTTDAELLAVARAVASIHEELPR